MSAVNNCTFIGHVTQNPTFQGSHEGTVARFMIMVHESQPGRSTQWISVVTRREKAEQVHQTLCIGDHVSITGRWSQQPTGVELELEDFSRLVTSLRTGNTDAQLDFADE